MEFLLGIDGGGTKTEILAGGVDGGVLARAVVAGTSLTRRSAAAVRDELALGLERLGLPMAACLGCWGGFASAGSAANRGTYATQLRTLLPRARVGVSTDLALAWQSAFGGDDGIVVIAGTGSAAYGRYRGREARAGGWGPGLGDEGSGDWIRRQGGTAADAASAEVLGRAGVELAKLAAAVGEALAWRDEVAVAAVGGVFTHAPLARAAFARRVLERMPGARLRAAFETPAAAALRMARQDYNTATHAPSA